MADKIQLIIKNQEDRRKIVAMLADNGYSVKIDRVKVGSQTKSVVIAWREEVEGNGRG